MKNLPRFFLTPLLLLLVVASACGGGSQGTGGATIDGKLLNSASQPVADATVTGEETGNATKTDALGAFQLSAPRGDTATLRIEKGTLSARVAIPVGANAVRVTTTLRVSANEDGVDADDIFEEDEDNLDNDNDTEDSSDHDGREDNDDAGSDDEDNNDSSDDGSNDDDGDDND